MKTPTLPRRLRPWLLLPLLAAVAAFAQSPAAPKADPAARKPASVQVGSRAWKGDLDGMEKRKLIRVLVPFSKTFYYVDKGRPSGITYDVFTAFEKYLNEQLKSKTLKVHVTYLPTGRGDLINKLVDGYGDVIFADLTVTPERQKIVDFSAPMYTGIDEVIVTGPGAPAIASLADLSGKEVFVRRTSSYYEHLAELNEQFRKEGKAPVTIRVAAEELEAEDILEMVNAGIIPVTVVDRYKAVMWGRVFKNLQVVHAVAVHKGSDNAFMLRKDSPLFKAALDGFVKKNAAGTVFGNSIVNRYVKNEKFVKNALGADERKRFGDTVELFRKYGDKYDVDYLLMMAQGFQESTLDQNAKSAVGAVGVMQIMPATGAELKVGDIHQTEANIHAGIKYMRWIVDNYYKNEPMTPLNKVLFAFAGYNAGQGRIGKFRKEAAARGLDPNRWFNNVEIVAADKVGSETVTYVSNIYKYYTAYKLIEAQDAERKAAREQLKATPAAAPAK